MIHRYFVTAPRGLAGLLRDELEELGAGAVREEPGGCRVRGPLQFGYRICLHSRIASRVLLGLGEVVAADADELYDAVRAMSWEDHVQPTATIAVDFVGTGAGIEHSNFGAQRIKDAIVDRFRDRTGQRPSVDRRRPDVRINAFARGKGCALAIDLAGESLHRRGYREPGMEAPMKENLAAALLRFAGWTGEGTLVDPLCGGGTIAIEAALVSAGRAPGSLRERFGFEGWAGHDAAVWEAVKAEAQGEARGGTVVGFDRNRAAIDAAVAAATRAGVEEVVRFELRALADGPLPEGMVVTNPPYGERLGDKAASTRILGELGERIVGRSFGIVLSDDDLLPALGCVPEETLAVMAGGIEARFARGVGRAPAGDLVNRLKKNLKRLAKWRKREGVSCYRLYEADLPEYNAVVDVYGDHVVVAEYEAPAHVDADRAAARRVEIAAAVAATLGVPSSQVHLKTRRRQRGAAQYEREGQGPSIVVEEGGHRFRVSFDHLDTGLFLDHRITRQLIAAQSNGARFLNLFAYTATATVYAARAGARATTSVDLSRAYLQWAEENFALNGIAGPQHRLVRADVLRFAEEDRGTYELIFLDPPTFSNSKAMRESFDVQRDHAALLEALAPRLAPGGALLFSTNQRRFRLDDAVARRFDLEDITARTTPPDFSRRQPHAAWWLRAR